MFRRVPLSITRSVSLRASCQQVCVTYTIAVCTVKNFWWWTEDQEQDQDGTSSVLILLADCQQTCMTYTIAVCTVKNSWRWERNCPKHVEVYSKNKFEKLVHLVGFGYKNSHVTVRMIARVVWKYGEYFCSWRLVFSSTRTRCLSKTISLKIFCFDTRRYSVCI